MVRITTRVQFDRVCPEVARAPNGFQIGIDEETAPDTGGAEARNSTSQSCRIVRHIEPSLRRYLLATFGNDRGFPGTDALSQVQDRIAECHFEVESRSDPSREAFDVRVLDMTAILAQVRRYPVGAGLFANVRCGERIGFVGTACLTNGGHVVNVDEQALVIGVHGSGRFHVWRLRRLPRLSSFPLPLIHCTVAITFAFKLAWSRS